MRGCFVLAVVLTYQMSELALTSVDAMLAMDSEDESLRRYKEQLLGAAAHGDRGGIRVCFRCGVSCCGSLVPVQIQTIHAESS